MTYGKPISSVAELVEVDNDDDLFEGYQDGRANEPEPKGNRSKSYWHGWRNGQVDGGHAESDDAQKQLARDYLRKAK